MILLDTDMFSLHQSGHARVKERIKTAREVPATTLITQIEAVRGRYDALMKAEDGDHVLRSLHGLERTIKHLALFEIVSFDAAAAIEFDRLLGMKGLRRIGRGDLLIASIALANRRSPGPNGRHDPTTSSLPA